MNTDELAGRPEETVDALPDHEALMSLLYREHGDQWHHEFGNNDVSSSIQNLNHLNVLPGSS